MKKISQHIKMSKQDYIKQFIKDYGHSFGMGFFVELHTGEVMYNGTDEYKEWYEEKEKEYLNQNEDEKIN